MVYLTHRPTYALNGASLRSAYGRIEVWSNNSTLDRATGLFKQVIFVIPIFFLGMFAANVEELRVAFALSSEDNAKKNPVKDKELLTKNLQFGTYGFVQGSNNILLLKMQIRQRTFSKGKPCKMAFGEDRKFHFSWGESSFVIESLTKLEILTRVRNFNLKKDVSLKNIFSRKFSFWPRLLCLLQKAWRCTSTRS